MSSMRIGGVELSGFLFIFVTISLPGRYAVLNECLMLPMLG